MLHRFLKLFVTALCAVMLLALCTTTAEASSRVGRVAGVARAGQDWTHAKLKIRWHAVRGATGYQMRVAPNRKRLSHSKVVRTRTARGTYTRALSRNRMWVVQVRALKHHKKGKWSRPRAVKFKRSAAVSVPPVRKPWGLIQFSDFRQSHTAASDFRGRSLAGNGRTTYRMAPHTSTRGQEIAGIPKGKSNPYRLLAFGGDGPPSAAKNLGISGFSVRGTDQGHSYGGLRVGYSQSAHLHDFTVKGIPGHAPGPPGETFSVATYHSDQALMERIKVDGRNDAGKPVAATLFGINSSVGTVIRNCVANYAAYGMALAVWDSKDTTVTDFDARYSRHPINFEQAHPGFIRLTRVDMRGQTDGGPNITVNSNLGSSKVTIIDPKVDRWPLRVGVSKANYIGKPQLQKASDVTLIINGKNVTGDKSKLAVGQVW
jgi:hypothetical protein